MIDDRIDLQCVVDETIIFYFAYNFYSSSDVSWWVARWWFDECDNAIWLT